MRKATGYFYLENYKNGYLKFITSRIRLIILADLRQRQLLTIAAPKQIVGTRKDISIRSELSILYPTEIEAPIALFMR